VRRRLAASLIDLLFAIAALAAVIGAGVGTLAHAHKRPGLDRRIRRLNGAIHPPALGPDALQRLRSRRAQLLIQLVAFAAFAPVKERRSLGYRLLRLRRVDALTGADASRTQEVVRAAVRAAWRALNRCLIPTPPPRFPEDHEQPRAQVQAARPRHSGDREAFNEAIGKLYRDAGSSPLRSSCLPILLTRVPLAVAVDLPFWSSLNQSLPDKLAGTVVVLDGPSQARR
jgi:hypothetical protein